MTKYEAELIYKINGSENKTQHTTLYTCKLDKTETLRSIIKTILSMYCKKIQVDITSIDNTNFTAEINPIKLEIISFNILTIGMNI